ncbi:MAG: coenzyme F420-0:L-glutamate ligase [Faecalibacterium sp.]|nr:coenzyme F420-0:L-glutamate ligase [Ruminococcus sp.]MCM1391638.1 coenzyme F420-0:L-glutamate ligase [Ruminococcus sp.]MCM1485753.1 coenzyme F420-0:L-glutamate ligase [Faecalibacterium sp.]
MEFNSLKPNENKNLNITTDFGTYSRYPVRTHVIMSGENINDIIDQYLPQRPSSNDFVFISEKVIAICQGRAFDIDDIHPSPLAKIMCKFVYKSPYGIGLGSPWTMELALRDVGVPKMMLAAVCSAVTKPFGVRGVFYKIAGTKARAIDGPCDCTIPPYNHYAKLAPKDPDKVAEKLEKKLGCKVVIIDANDIGVEVLGRSDEEISVEFCKQVFTDNPLGQSSQSTPIAVVRKVD